MRYAPLATLFVCAAMLSSPAFADVTTPAATAPAQAEVHKDAAHKAATHKNAAHKTGTHNAEAHKAEAHTDTKAPVEVVPVTK